MDKSYPCGMWIYTANYRANVDKYGACECMWID